ncbi:MAG: hypothetical protein COZ75_01460 [Flavobacteriaceae bacterium CG_4_8_14_3_um_filter_34_10]|nr:lipid-binding SYLF domain-containing protein [Flavobacteriia bacterium]OIP49844.1 MAG: hypothetical protein AUK33_09275 [Flavobacteriaceae bacterium CG2_30_34_30]PIQ18908.1 MAG: hypothetical protein COW66_03880 [Flavobacteriaceae bacterium CG18_big_fil_WC_8_21_14_2_50_34_36]PIV48961.1 MAG: hypothetical protein COS19_11060 [Flavobacteriaceae bacterium CG02_land_8_20_14_3_00_34_13]PIX10466.1 MAG: hypothetical protein COZ75_01460 [Flavobacteriaceae bacterium CG_4_8_14_3_um_filter_34_10]PIZ0863
MKTSNFIMLLVLMVSTSLFSQTQKDKEIIRDAEIAKAEFIKINKEIAPQLKSATAYVLFPNVGKGAFIVGAASGNGAVYQNGVLIGLASMKQLDLGLQAGGETYSEMILFETEEAFNRLKTNKLELTAGASAVALQSGEAIKAKYADGIAVYVLPKAGLMIDASVGGQKLEYIPLNN